MDDMTSVREALRGMAPIDLRPPSDLADVVVRRARWRGEVVRAVGGSGLVVAVALAAFELSGASNSRPDPARVPSVTAAATTTAPTTSSDSTSTLPTYPLPTSTTDDAFNDYVARADAGLPQLERIGTADPDFLMVAKDARLRGLIVYRKGGSDSRYPDRLKGLPVIVRVSVLNAAEERQTVAAFLAARKSFAQVGVTVSAVGPDASGGPIQVHVDRVTPQSQTIARSIAPFGPDSFSFADPLTANPGGHHVP